MLIPWRKQFRFYVMEIEDKLVQDYGLVKRCQLQQVENGISVCRFKGDKENVVL